MNGPMTASREQCIKALFVALHVNRKLNPRYPIVVNLIGPPGCGKTTAAVQFADMIGADFFMARTGATEAPELQGLPEIVEEDWYGSKIKVVRYITPTCFPPVHFPSDRNAFVLFDEADRQQSPEAVNTIWGMILENMKQPAQ